MRISNFICARSITTGNFPRFCYFSCVILRACKAYLESTIPAEFEIVPLHRRTVVDNGKTEFAVECNIGESVGECPDTRANAQLGNRLIIRGTG